ncbi:hypothetical protein PG988_015576 [Apiospora saccharicola]
MMGSRTYKRGKKATPRPTAVTSRKGYESLASRNNLLNRIKRRNRLLKIQRYEIRYQEVVELRWALLKSQCFEQARQLFGPQMSHVVYDAVNCGNDGIKDSVKIQGEEPLFRVTVHCIGRRPSDSIAGKSERTALPLPSPEQQKYELEQLDDCLAGSLQERSQWMPRRLVLEVFDWLSDSWDGITSRRRAEFCHGSFDACAAVRMEAPMLPTTEVPKVPADAELEVDNDDSGEESYVEAVTP